MKHTHFDAIIVGGSYSGLAAGMALGRALRQVLIIDSGLPCNRQTPYSHNFITHDGTPPAEIARLAKQQVQQYSTVGFLHGLATAGHKTKNGFEIQTAAGETASAKKLIFATGIRDLMPPIEGYADCWGISALHCPYCHGYEVRGKKTGILGNGNDGYEFASLLFNWTKDLTLYTNGPSALTPEQSLKLKQHHINIVETDIEKVEHQNGQVQNIVFKTGATAPVHVLYGRQAFEQHCAIPTTLGCELTEDHYLKVNALQETTVPGVFACGDNVTRLRTVANAVAMGAMAGMAVNKALVTEEF